MAKPHWKALDEAITVAPGKSPKLTDKNAKGDDFFDDKDEAEACLKADVAAINELQDRLYAEGARALLVVLQGMDTSGKDGTVRGVFNETGPLGVEVHAFGRPSEEELSRDYLWRVHKVAPRKGMIGIFNRSHYEDVLIGRVRQLASEDQIEQRYAQINAFEKLLTETGTVILKFMLHISKDEQAERLQERLDDPLKQWKFNPGDLDDRKLWSNYMDAYELALSRCSTAYAPWRIVPADKKWRRNAMIACIVRGALEDMNPQPRRPDFDPKDFKIV
jgi:PPK2 family polyphosphate:nucleotide phosphotransferase